MNDVAKGPGDAAEAVTVHTMGVHYRWELPQIVETQLRLAHDTREDFVALDLAYGEDVKAIWSSYPGVAAAETAVRLKQLRADQKALYSKYSELGLYWATFNDVAAHHKSVVQRINKARREGRPARLRHHRFDGTGTLTVQIQRRDAAPVRTPATLADSRR